MAAKIRIQKVDGEAERLMCIGLIASDKVIKQLAPIMSPDILESKCAQSLAAWSLDYFKEFGAAPKLHIQDIFESKKRNFLDDDVADLIERMLVSINEQMHDQTDLNEDYIIVECEKLIKSRKAKMLAEDITAYLSKGQVLEAEEAIDAYTSAPQQAQPQAFQIDLEEYSAERRLTSEPPPVKYLLRNTLPRQCLGVIAGASGAGKSTLTRQLLVALASKEPAFDGIFHPTRENKCIYISAEEDQTSIDRGIFFALEDIADSDLRERASKNIFGVSELGKQVALCKQTRQGEVEPTKNLYNLRKLIEKYRPNVVALDTWSRFMPLRDETDNSAATAACSLLESISREFDVNFLTTHHVTKASGDYIQNENGLHIGLSQHAVRGAGAIVACARWTLMIVPLSKDYATKKLPEITPGPSGTAVALRVVNANNSAPAPHCFLIHGEEGLLYAARPATSTTVEEDAKRVREEIERRQQAGESTLSRTRPGQGMDMSKRAYGKAVEYGIEHGMFKAQKRDKGLDKGSGKGEELYVPERP